ncbi:MAG: tetratricopeptide repeat protein [Candidatus Eremiobacteraeota bacterium]|nr:tetratricopeptide repeat protein [Candidatus Eremiobacteraeota bacterium]
MEPQGQDAGYYAREGYSLLREQRVDEARELLEKALSLDDTHRGALNSLGFIYYFAGEFEKGVALCQKTVGLYPGDAYAHKGLGLHLAKTGRVAEGVEALKKALILDPGFTDAYHDLAVVYHEQGDFQSARLTLEEGLKKAGTPRQQKQFRRFLEKLGQ